MTKVIKAIIIYLFSIYQCNNHTERINKSQNSCSVAVKMTSSLTIKNLVNFTHGPEKEPGQIPGD